MVAALLMGTGAEAAVCARASEQPALSARVLQTQLMVAALACGESGRYNDFVRKFSPELSARSRTLMALFERQYGRGAESQLNRFVTVLANAASARSATTSRFCTDAVVLFDTLQQTEPALFTEVALSQPFAGTHGITTCRE